MTRASRKRLIYNLITFGLVIAAFIILQNMITAKTISRTLKGQLVPICCWIAMAVSLNLVIGISGELSLGHAGFMSVGLFTGCLVSIALSGKLPLIARLPLCMLIGGVCAGLFGFAVGMPALRRKGDYLAIVTLACGEIVKNVITNLKITGGARGLNTQSIYSGAKQLLPYAIVTVFLTVIVMMHIKKSKQGRAIMAIRDNRIAAESIGLNVTYYKLAVFIIAAFFAGAAGALYGHFFANVKAVTFDYNMSIEILVIVVLGGMGSVRGSVIAAMVMQALPEVFRDFGDYRMLVYAVALILAMLFTNSPRLQEFRRRVDVVPRAKEALRKRHLARVISGAKQEGGEDHGA